MRSMSSSTVGQLWASFMGFRQRQRYSISRFLRQHRQAARIPASHNYSLYYFCCYLWSHISCRNHRLQLHHYLCYYVIELELRYSPGYPRHARSVSAKAAAWSWSMGICLECFRAAVTYSPRCYDLFPA